MKSRDDLISVLNLGWETARRAWRLLAPDVEFTVDSVGTSGRDMDQVAYDLRRLGHGKPARLAFSVAFILNGLARGTIEYDRDLAEKASQIVSILAEMLLELEATSQVTAQEPADIVELLQSRWGLVLWSEDHAAAGLPRPHFRVESPLKQEADEVLAGVAEISDALILASESLLQRTERDGDFPYRPSLSRIHHLGLLIRERTAAHIPATSVTSATLSGAAVNPNEPELALIDDSPVNTSQEPEVRLVETATTEPCIASSIEIQEFSNRVRNVLIIDESPFFRMLLTSAIEAAGYASQVAGSLLEVRQSVDAAPWDLVICSAQFASDEVDLDWMQGRSIAMILLESAQTNSTSQGLSQAHRIRRTDLAGLMALVKSTLGPGTRDVRLSA